VSKRETFVRFTKRWSGWFSWVGVFALVLLVCVSTADVVGNKVLVPITGSVDICGLFQVFVVASALAYTQVFKRHVAVDFVIRRLPERAQRVFRLGNRLLSLLLFGLVIYAVTLYGVTIQTGGFLSPTLAIPLFPFAYVIAFGCMLLFLVLLGELFELLGEFGKK
jgi:TRAP-type C4-dicarboxylate transport system permease small subunit